MRGILIGMIVGFLQVGSATAETSSAASAAESKSEIKLRDVIAPKKFEEDKRITDLELRAQAGSLSRYSLKFDLGFSGPPVNGIHEPLRPNPDNRPGDSRTNLSGHMGLRYRISSDKAINVSTGMKWFTPYQAIIGQEVERRPGAKNYDFNNPSLSFDKTYAAGPAQLRSSVRSQLQTEESFKRAGQVASLGVSQSVKYTPMQGPVILGATAVLDFFGYERAYQPAGPDGRGGDGNVSKYYLNFIPSVEYKLSSVVNFNTSIGYPYQNLRSDNSWWRWSHPLSTWRVGLGWAITRDVYINPYVNFFLESPAFNTASLNLNTVFSIF